MATEKADFTFRKKIISLSCFAYVIGDFYEFGIAD